MVDLTVKIGGEAGFGIMTIGLLMGKIATRSGYYAFEYSEYPSLIRGGHNVTEIRISDEKVYSQEKKADILVCLDRQTYDLHKDKVKQSGIVVVDEEENDISRVKVFDKDIFYLDISFTKIIKERGFKKVVLNNIALGSLMHLLGADLDILNNLISERFAKKGEEMINENIQAAKAGFDFAKANYPDGYKIKIPKRERITPKMYITGNEMIGLSSIVASCQMYVAYPMTPATPILHYLAAKAEESGMVVKHAEDEISVINMALGASWAGARSMVGTSGGGFALMVEAVSLSGITEIPIVIAMIQRPGPASGMPTWTGQGDLLFTVHAGHGEFLKIILAPGDVEEAYKLTIEAFDLADKYQTPVFILGDKYLMEGHQSLEESRIKNYELRINRGKLLTQEQLSEIKNYKRYLVTNDGISPRAVPGMKGSLHQANSYEHLEDGHSTEDEEERIRQVDKRNRKADTFLKEDYKMPALFG